MALSKYSDGITRLQNMGNAQIVCDREHIAHETSADTIHPMYSFHADYALLKYATSTTPTRTVRRLRIGTKKEFQWTDVQRNSI